MGCLRRSRNWTSFSSPWARAWDGHEAVAALDDKTEAVIRELEARHKEARRSLRRRPDHVRGPPRSPEKTYQDLMGWLERLSTGAHVAAQCDSQRQRPGEIIMSKCARHTANFALNSITGLSATRIDSCSGVRIPARLARANATASPPSIEAQTSTGTFPPWPPKKLRSAPTTTPRYRC